jgi:flagellar motor protein MotB
MIGTARADGLPGEFLLSTRWRDLMWAHSPLTNPAFLTQEDYITARGAFATTLQGAFSLWEAGVTVPVGMRQSAGLSIVSENDGSIENWVFDDATGQMVRDNSTLSNNNFFGMGSYAVSVWRGLSVGANLNLAYQSNFGNSVKGIGFDLGCSYRLRLNPRAGNHTVGLSTVNLVAPSMGTTFRPGFGGDGEYSRDLRVSWMGDFRDRQFESGLDVDLKDFLATTDEFGGDKKVEWTAAWRGGAWLRRVLGGYLQLGFGSNVLEYWGIAAGVRLPVSNTGPKVTVLYQYNMKTEGQLASAHTAYMIVQFGKNRKDLWGPRLAALAKRAVRDSTAERRRGMDRLRKIRGINIEEEQEYVRITADEVAVHFKSGSCDLPLEAIPALKEIADFLREYPDHDVSIEGHTDSDPITGHLKEVFIDNATLSKARAVKVMEYFIVTEKLPAHLFGAAGWGETKPIVPNDTPANKYKNRRVVLIIKK